MQRKMHVIPVYIKEMPSKGIGTMKNVGLVFSTQYTFPNLIL